MKAQAELSDLVAAAAKITGTGPRGGTGGTAVTGGDRSGIEKLGLLDPVLALHLEGKKIVVRDLVTDLKWRYDLDWTPHQYTVNGINFMTFGGYLRFFGTTYGVPSESYLAPDEMLLENLHDYRPLTTERKLTLFKNGAVAYR